ncbi:DUF2854 domain-containing protein [Nostoc sp. FACHB-152]|uniref:DUF2854 domain-containing protein n=1 Tax=unclassified Nostoc TaxID=2593658 RepID=UPI001687953F|nr:MULTISPECIES: DUF2854 domain-containing protein [unclassified Nostoc]MBD2446745.1 DUF2854 domain-containing protein [Nostoc sp. FACHB-152]MBD2466593.1 DUF2854 domain-containing protein [Nostoc sp. FACHB-145]
MLRQISLGTLGLTIGSILTIVGFIAYAANNATLNLVGFFYGFPLLLGGLALKANELKPIPFTQATTPQVLSLRQQQATVTQNKIRKDITRYCYGQDDHFDTALTYLGLSPSDEDRPTVTGLREEETNGAYTLILEFDSPFIPINVWQEKQEKMTSYFGPGVEIKITQPGENKIELALITSQ